MSDLSGVSVRAAPVLTRLSQPHSRLLTFLWPAPALALFRLQLVSHFRQMIGGVDVTFVGDAFAAFAITLRIVRRPGGKTVHVTIEHAEGGGDQHRVVNFLVRGAVFARAIDVRRGDLLAALLNFSGNCQQRFQLV
jgi:hypothetical protein